MIRVVIDTNVLVSALISPYGNEAFLLLAIAQGLLIACFSQEMEVEYTEVLARPKFSFPPHQISSIIDLIRTTGIMVAPATLRFSLPDASDAKFVACAQHSSADFIVTGNKRHFPKDLCGGIPVVNAAELLDFMTLER